MIGFYAGSFDPFTNGHLAVVKKATACFDEVIIGIGVNYLKTRRIDETKMKEAIEETLEQENIKNAKVILYRDLTVDEARKYGADMLIRGLRNGTDYDYEENIAQVNEKIADIDTCYFRAGKLGYLSSSIVMDIYGAKKEIDEFVPTPVAKLLYSLNK